MSKLKVAFLVNQFPSISETFILNQITGLIDLSCEVKIFANYPEKDVNPHPDFFKYSLLEKIHYFPKKPKNYFLRVFIFIKLIIENISSYRLILKSLNIFKYGKDAASLNLFYMLIPFLENQDFDILHCHFGMLGRQGVLLKNIGAHHAKVITTFHGVDMSLSISKLGNSIYDDLFENGDFFLPISYLWKKRLLELGCHGDKIKVHRMGVNCNTFDFLQRATVSSNTVKLVSVARLVEKKGIEYGIKAISLLKQKYDLDVKYYIVGSGPLRSHLESLAKQLNIESSIYFTGAKTQKELYQILIDSDILILPSVTSQNGDQEGIPVSAMEAMAMGLPVVATHHSAIPELVVDGVTGFLVPEKDVDELAAKIFKLTTSPELIQRFSTNGRREVECNFNIEDLNRDLFFLFHKLLSR